MKNYLKNLINNDKFSDEIKVDMMKKQLDKSYVYPEVKNKIANYFIVYLKDSEINNELKENLQNHLISYICESAENSVLNEFLNTYENDVDKSKIVKHILDKLKNEHEKVIKLESLVDFCFISEHESMIGEAFIKDLITTLSFLNSNDDSGAVPINASSSKISGGVVPYSPELFQHIYPRLIESRTPKNCFFT